MVQMEGQSPEDSRAWLLGAAVAGLNVLAALAAQSEETADLGPTFLSVAAVWGEREREEGSSSLRLQRRQ